MENLQRWEYQTCLLRNLYAGQEATVRTGHGTTDWFQIVKGVHQGCILSPCLLNFYAEVQIVNVCWIIEKAREFQKNIYFDFIDYANAFDCVDHNKLWEILKAMERPDHLTCLLRNLYAGQEAAVRTGHGAID